MKRLLIIAVGLLLAGAVTVNAAKGKRQKEDSTEQKQLLKDMQRKYDTNRDKTLDKSELAKVSAEDKEKMEKAGVWSKVQKTRDETTPEQKQLLKDMKQKYDTNSDKKVDKGELEKVSADDKAKMEKAGVWPKDKNKDTSKRKERREKKEK